MWLSPKVSPPSVEPVTLAEVKRQARAEYHTDDDTYFGELIAAARDHVESYCGVTFAQRDVEMQATEWADLCRLPVMPVADMVVAYTDSAGDTQVVSDDTYELRGDGIVLMTGHRWPARALGSLITVTATAGGACPPAVKHAMRLWVASAYEVREDTPSGGRTAFDDLLTNHRR